MSAPDHAAKQAAYAAHFGERYRAIVARIAAQLAALKAATTEPAKAAPDSPAPAQEGTP